jgi:hypothetical protein
MSKTTRNRLLAGLLDSAEQHGEDGDPDHEVGDLRDILEYAWTLLTLAQRREVHEHFLGPGGSLEDYAE